MDASDLLRWQRTVEHQIERLATDLGTVREQLQQIELRLKVLEDAPAKGISYQEDPIMQWDDVPAAMNTAPDLQLEEDLR